jgi:hypothetical protein
LKHYSISRRILKYLEGEKLFGVLGAGDIRENDPMVGLEPMVELLIQSTPSALNGAAWLSVRIINTREIRDQ